MGFNLRVAMKTELDRYPWLWDVDLDNAAFEDVLRGRKTAAGLDTDWAMLRLIEYAPYREIRRLLPVGDFLRKWPELMAHVRSESRRRGMDFLAAWIQRGTAAHA